MYHHLIFADDQQPRDTSQPRRTPAPIVSVGEKDFYDPARPDDAAEYRLVLSYSQR